MATKVEKIAELNTKNNLFLDSPFFKCGSWQ
jgi:hypothetical protein